MGSAFRATSTGKGVVCTIRCACEYLGISIPGLRVAIQGLGNVGMVAAKELAALGCQIVAVADISGGLKAADGIDLSALQLHMQDNGSLLGFPGAQPMAASDIFAQECDILVPAASGSQIHERNAVDVRARLIAEGANAPVTPDAHVLLQERGVTIIPDILCNAGGVFVSYLEYAQETQREQMPLKEVQERMKQRMTEAFQEVLSYSEATGLPWRESALDIAIGRVAEGIRARGGHP